MMPRSSPIPRLHTPIISRNAVLMWVCRYRRHDHQCPPPRRPCHHAPLLLLPLSLRLPCNDGASSSSTRGDAQRLITPQRMVKHDGKVPLRPAAPTTPGHCCLTVVMSVPPPATKMITLKKSIPSPLSPVAYSMMALSLRTLMMCSITIGCIQWRLSNLAQLHKHPATWWPSFSYWLRRA